MLKNNNGFTIVEALIGAGIIFTAATSILPLSSLINQEEEILHQHRTYANLLHDELQRMLWEEDSPRLPFHFTKTDHGTSLDFQFTKEDHLTKGCVEWENVKKEQETICLYGHPAK